MKKCDKCNKQALVIQNDEELCIKHYNPSGHHTWEDNEEETKTEDKEIKDDYILL